MLAEEVCWYMSQVTVQQAGQTMDDTVLTILFRQKLSGLDQLGTLLHTAMWPVGCRGGIMPYMTERTFKDPPLQITTDLIEEALLVRRAANALIDSAASASRFGILRGCRRHIGL